MSRYTNSKPQGNADRRMNGTEKTKGRKRTVYCKNKVRKSICLDGEGKREFRSC